MTHADEEARLETILTTHVIMDLYHTRTEEVVAIKCLAKGCEFSSGDVSGAAKTRHLAEVIEREYVANRVEQAKAEAAEQIAQGIERFAQEVLDAGKRYGWPLTPGNVAKNAGHLEAASEARMFVSRFRPAAPSEEPVKHWCLKTNGDTCPMPCANGCDDERSDA